MRRLLDWMRVAMLDLRGDVRRFGVLIACLALGTAVIAAVGSVGNGLKLAVINEATTLMGGDLEASRPDRDATADELAFLETFGTVAHVVDTNARAVANGNSGFIDISAVSDNYPLFGDVGSPELGPGEKPAPMLAERDGVFGALVDPVLLQELGIGLGDEFTVGQSKFEARGFLSSLPDGATRGFHLGLTTVLPESALITLQDLRPPLPGLLSQHRYKIKLDGWTYEDAAAAIAKQFNDPDWSVRSPRDAAGNLARYYDLFTRYLLIVGLSSLLVGGVGVYTGVTAYIGERQRSIATMRSLGATGPRIIVHFLTQVGVLTVIGVAIGVIAGAVSSLVALPIVGKALSINLPSSLNLPALITAGGFGILCGFAFSYLPLARARRISPALLFRSLGTSLPKPGRRDQAAVSSGYIPVLIAALGIFGLAVYSTSDVMLVAAYAVGVVGAYFILRGAAILLQRALKLLPSPANKSVRYALRNIHRPGSTAPIVILSLGLGLSMLLIIALLNANLRDQLLGVVSKDAPTFVATDLFEDEVMTLEEMQKSDPAFVRFQWSPSIRARVVRVAGRDAREVKELSDETTFLVAPDIPVTWRAEQPADGTIVEGQWWPADYDGPPLISLRTTIRDTLGLKLGDKIEFELFGDTIEATIANFRDYQWQVGLNFMVIFSPGLIQDYPATSLGTMKAAEGQEKALEASLTSAFPEVAFIPIGDALRQAVNLLGQLAAGVNVVGALAVINGLLVLAGTMAAGRKQREADAIVHKVLGATRSNVLWVFSLEYGFLGAYAAIAAGIVGICGAWAITRSALEVGFSADPVLVGLVVILAVVMTITAGAVTTWGALSTSPARALRDV